MDIPGARIVVYLVWLATWFILKFTTRNDGCDDDGFHTNFTYQLALEGQPNSNNQQNWHDQVCCLYQEDSRAIASYKQIAEPPCDVL